MKKKLVSLVLMLVVLLGVSMPSMALTGTPRNLNPGRSPISASQSEMSRNVDSIGGKMLSTVAILGGILLILIGFFIHRKKRRKKSRKRKKRNL